MKKLTFMAAGLLLPLMASAQGAVDGFALSRQDMRGTARFMSMGGAFTALGADLSAISYNPGGIGVYRGSEVGATFNLSAFSSNANTPGKPDTRGNVVPYLNNLGYVGTFNLNNSTVRSFSWGLSYNKTASFNRRFRGHGIPLTTSMSNYIADMSNKEGVTEGAVLPDDNYDPYNPWDSDLPAPWLSILAYQGFLINPHNTSATETNWTGLWGPKTRGEAYMQGTESGGVDQYDFTIGGNIADVFFWGMDFGITDLNYKKTTLYGENLVDAMTVGDRTAAHADWDLYNYYKVNGTGFNYSLGIIVKPIQELRIGFAFHTPTWYSMNEYFYANTTYYISDYVDPPRGGAETNGGYNGFNEYNYRTPWKINAGIAGVLFNRLILSADYNWEGTTGIHYSDTWNDSGDSYYYTNYDIRRYYRSSQAVRIGAEYRITPSLSVRAGYSYVSSPVKSKVADGQEEIYTAGTRPEYSLDNSTNYVTLGLGYRYKKFYIDAAYVLKTTSAQWHGFSPTAQNAGHILPQTKVDYTTNQVLLSAGFRF